MHSFTLASLGLLGLQPNAAFAFHVPVPVQSSNMRSITRLQATESTSKFADAACSCYDTTIECHGMDPMEAQYARNLLAGQPFAKILPLLSIAKNMNNREISCVRMPLFPLSACCRM